MIVGFGIGIGRNRFGISGGTPPVVVFSTTEWQLLNTITWENITDTWT
jgi:hypothetical protein